MNDEGPGGPRGRASAALFRFPPFEFDAAAGLVYRADEETLLPPKAAQVLQLLLESAGQLVSKDDLLETIWEDAYVTESSLTDAISLLRRVLGDDTRDPSYIQTLHRRGYRFIGTVEERAAPAPDAESEAPPSVEPRVPGEGGLQVGDRLGNYEILGTLGAGAMGTVYRARDTTLEREVAIKLLREDLAADPERLARLEREAKLLASVSHPNIATILSLEEADGIRFPVLELVEGRTLEDRLRSERMGRKEALETARQIAMALEAAHQRGIIHRDLKPANIKCTPEGQVKVLDFGLAKGLEVISFANEAAESPTASMTIKGTGRGSIVGTAAYMSPEQARGQDVDQRADIWSFGCVLYEMLTGKKPFGGATLTDTLAAILDEEPDLDALPANTPKRVRYLVRRCLRKEPERRLHDIADARIEIEDSLRGAATVGALAVETRRSIPWKIVAPVAALVVAVAAFLAWRLMESGSDSRLTQRFHIDLPVGSARPVSSGHTLAISRDGQTLVFVAATESGTQLFLRRMNQFASTPIPGTEGAIEPFLSPDGESVAFEVRNATHRVSLLGGDPFPLCEPCEAGSWGDDGNIYFIQEHALWRIPDVGGDPESIADLELDETLIGASRPRVLPGSKVMLLQIRPTNTAGVAAYSLQTHEVLVVSHDGSDPRYASTGHIVFQRGGTLHAVGFDVGRFELIGQPVPVVQGVRAESGGALQAAISDTGTLVYGPGTPGAARRLIWVDRDGTLEAVTDQLRNFSWPRLSPDGGRIVVVVDGDIFVHEIRQGTLRRLTTDGVYSSPVWTHDGMRVVFATAAEGLRWMDSDFSDEQPHELLIEENRYRPRAWAGDSNTLVVEAVHPDPGQESDVVLLSVKDNDTVGDPAPFATTSSHEAGPALSPDGAWIAYTSNVSGRNEVYVEPFPEGGRTVRVSTVGGVQPLWGPDDELFYRSGDRLVAARVQTEPGFEVVGQDVLFELPLYAAGSTRRGYDITPDGQRFLAVDGPVSDDVHDRPRINVVLNWFEELKERMPTRR